MKKWSQRITSLLLAGVLLLGLTACGGDSKGGSKGSKGNQEAKQNVYKYEELDFSLGQEENKSSNINSVTVIDERIYALITEYNYGEVYGFTLKLISMDKTGNDKNEVVLGTFVNTDGKDRYINQIKIVEGNIYGLEESYDYSNTDEYGNGNHTIELICWNLEGQEQWRKSVMPENLTPEQYFYVNTMLPLPDGELLLLSSLSLDVYTNTGELKSSKPMDSADGGLGNYSNMFIGKDGKVYVTVYNDDWTKMSAKVLDLTTGKLGEEQELPPVFTNYSVLGAGKQYDLLLSNNTGIYGFNFGTTDLVPIMNFINSDLPTTSMNFVVELSDTEIIASYYDEEYYGMHMALFTYVDPKDIPDKEVLVLGTYYINSEMRKRVVDFNKTNEKYRISVNDYSRYNTGDDYMAGYTQLNNDILAGKIPDILSLNDEMPLDSYIAKGLFADINTFLDKDEELNREDYFENVFNAYSVNGKMYRIVSNFYVWTVMGKTADVGSEPGWTLQELKDLVATKPEGTQIFGKNFLRSDVMMYGMNMSGGQFINKDTGKCNFNSQGFIELLEFAKQFPAEYQQEDGMEDWWRDYYSQYRDGTTLLAVTSLYSPSDLVYSLKGSFGEEPVTFIGFPAQEGIGSVIWGGEQYAISARSSNQEGAWEFMRYYYTDEYQETVYSMPINKEIWKEKSKKSMEKPYWEDENGIKTVQEYTQWIGDDQEIILNPLTQEEVDAIYNFVSSLDQAYYQDRSLMNIIDEEAAPYFEGQKSVTEVADIIQSRAQIYVNENR